MFKNISHSTQSKSAVLFFFWLSKLSKCLYVQRRHLIKNGFVERVSSKFLRQVFQGTESNYENIWSKCRDLLRKSPYSVRMWENTDQKNSEYGDF